MSRPAPDSTRSERAAKIRSQQARTERTRRLLMIVGIVVVLGAIIAAGVWFGSSGDDDDAAATKDLEVRAGEQSLILGPEDAETKVVVYEDFQCPYCRQFEQSTRDFLVEYAAEGVASVEYRPFPLLTDYPYSSRALNAFATVLENGTPEQAHELHDKLFDEQPYEHQSGDVTEDQIKGWVEDTGAGEDVVAALDDDKQDWFTAATKAAQEAQVPGTPSVFVDGELFGGDVSITEMADQLESLLAEKKK